jgi:hypothetical protein
VFLTQFLQRQLRSLLYYIASSMFRGGQTDPGLGQTRPSKNAHTDSTGGTLWDQALPPGRRATEILDAALRNDQTNYCDSQIRISHPQVWGDI